MSELLGMQPDATYAEDLPHRPYVLGAEVLAIADTVVSTRVLDIEAAAADTAEFNGEQVLVNALDAVREDAHRLMTSQDPWVIDRASNIRAGFKTIDRVLPPIFPEQTIHQDVLGWLASADDGALLNFLQWNEYSLRPLQTKLTDRIQHMEAFILDDAQRLADQGFLPEHIIQEALIERLLEKAVFHIADVYTIAGAAGEHYSGRVPHTAISERVLETDGFYSTVFHELFHTSIDLGYGLVWLYGDLNPDFAFDCLEEPTVEHIVQAAIFGDPETIDPSQRIAGEHHIYRDLRTLLSLLLYGGAQRIPLQSVTAAYFEHNQQDYNPDSARVCLRQLMADSFREAYPGDLYAPMLGIALSYNTAISPKHREHIMNEWILDIKMCTALVP
jgi:hypothetical protein